MDRFEEAGRAFAQLCRVMARLRRECPWDRQQTSASLKSYFVEETYEALQAIDDADAPALREELGDVLFQVVFHAEIAHDAALFDVAQVAEGITDKLVRRHPHVFAGLQVAPAEAAGLSSWEKLKAAERPPNTGLLSTIPRALPALLRADRVGAKAAAVGFDWTDADAVRHKVEEEWQELLAVMRAPPSQARLAEELGDLLFALCSLARHLRVNAEEALQHSLEKFRRRFEWVEGQLAASGRSVAGARSDELEALWQAAKAAEAKGDRR